MPRALITGFKSSGKTTVGRLLAERLGWRFVDLDDVIERLHNAETGEPATFREIYRQRGGEDFRELERRAARRLRDAIAPESPDLIVSLGGGSVMDNKARATLLGLGPLLYLKAPFAELLERVWRHGPPAFVSRQKVETDLYDLFQRREPYCLRFADAVVDIAGCDAEEAADRAEEALEGLFEASGHGGRSGRGA